MAQRASSPTSPEKPSIWNGGVSASASSSALGDLQLDLAGRQVRVDRLGARRTTVAGRAEHVLGPQLVGQLECLAGGVGVEDELDDAGAVAQVDEDQAAVVAAAMDPAGDPRLGVDPVAEHLAAPGVAVAVGAAGSERLAHRASPPVISSTRSPVSTGALLAGAPCRAAAPCRRPRGSGRGGRRSGRRASAGP